MLQVSSLVLLASLLFGSFALLISAKRELTIAKKKLSKSKRKSGFLFRIQQVFNPQTHFHGD